MKIRSIDTYKVTLPFRFGFGHSLATRRCSTNLFVKVTLENGTEGFGEGVPRNYVTGEDIDAAQLNVRRRWAPALIGLDLSEREPLLAHLKAVFYESDLHRTPAGASWCALELAVLDAASRASRLPLSQWLAPVITPEIRYGGVVPFAGAKALVGMLLFYKLWGYRTVKVKLGKDLDSDLYTVRLSRKIMGADTILRVDANCAWNPETAIARADALRAFNIASYEQPVPADDLEGLKKVTEAIPEDVVVDESLCTIEQAKLLAEEKLCNAFNIRLSKVGGFLAAKAMVEIADSHSLKCHLGAQVGESGILSAAARIFACLNEPFENYEGSANAFLLKNDVTRENLTAGFGGRGNLLWARNGQAGLGLTISSDRLGQAQGSPKGEIQPDSFSPLLNLLQADLDNSKETSR